MTPDIVSYVFSGEEPVFGIRIVSYDLDFGHFPLLKEIIFHPGTEIMTIIDNGISFYPSYIGFVVHDMTIFLNDRK